MRPAGPEDDQLDRKASRGAQRRVGRESVAPGPAVGTPAFCHREAGQIALWGPLDTPKGSSILFLLSLPETYTQYQRSFSGTGVPKRDPWSAPTSARLEGRESQGMKCSW